METIIRDQKLNCKREESTYMFVWNLARDESGKNFLFDYSKWTRDKLLPSGQMFCKTGCFQGQEKYFEFFTFTNCFKTVEIFLKMVRPANGQNASCSETFEIFSASVYAYTHTKYFNGALFVLSCAPEDFADKKIDSKCTVTWMKAILDNPSQPTSASVSEVTRLAFKIEVQHYMCGEKYVSTHQTDADIAEFTIDESKFNFTDQLSTTPFLFSSNISDVTVYCVDKEYPAHKLILASKSSVLAAMFTHPMQEGLNGKLNIEDASPEIVEEFLRFIYTGSVKDLEQNAVGLSLIAEKYDLPGLKAMSLNYLVRTISIENVVERYSLGKLLNSDGLVKKCIAKMKTDKKTIWNTGKDFFKVCQELPELFDLLFV